MVEIIAAYIVYGALAIAVASVVIFTVFSAFFSLGRAVVVAYRAYGWIGAVPVLFFMIVLFGSASIVVLQIMIDNQ